MDVFDYRDYPYLAAYIDRIGAEQLNHKRFMVRTWRAGYYEERSLIKLLPGGEIECSNSEHEPTKEERDRIIGEMASVEFPYSVPVSMAKAQEVERLKRDSDSKLYFILDGDRDKVIFVQERLEIEGKGKQFRPWSYFSDGEWRKMEPDGPLPFWKPFGSKGIGKARIMIHEGAKAAQVIDAECHNPKSTHPWISFLKNYEHWGLLGGALAPHRANYDELRDYQPREVIYSPDRDYSGKLCTAGVSKHYQGKMKYVSVGDHYPEGWDMADPIPESEFYEGRYIGKPIEKMIHPATWATMKRTVVDNTTGKAKKVVVLATAFAEEWMASVRPELYIHRDQPNRMLTPDEFNNNMKPFSDVENLAKLMRDNLAVKAFKIKYDPSAPPGILAGISETYINTHVGSHIEPEEGDVRPWTDYMEHLIPSEGDRFETLKYIATLIAKPEIKMAYGLLLVGDQGVGKTTLPEKVLRPLLGPHNVSTPSENDITHSDFNGWLAHKRLAYVNEIYAGGNSKAYDKLKSVITDTTITVNQKYQIAYEIENWCHIIACSNSRKPLKLDNDDRRWLIPNVTDDKGGHTWWKRFNNWLLFEGGLGKIMWWAHGFVAEHGHVLPGDEAPDTVAKRAMIEEGYSEGQQFVSDFCKLLREHAGQTVAGMKIEENPFWVDVVMVDVLRDVIHNGKTDKLEKPRTIRKVGVDQGWYDNKGQGLIPFRAKWGQAGRQKARIVVMGKADKERAPEALLEEGREPVNIRALVSAWKMDGRT